MSGYCDCACRDCFEIAIGGDDPNDPAMCHACEEAGCELDSECCAPDAYGGDEGDDDDETPPPANEGDPNMLDRSHALASKALREKIDVITSDGGQS
jgi:hypothetical protein